MCRCGRVSWVWRSARYARRRGCERPRSGRVGVDDGPYGRVPGVRRGRECGRIASVCTCSQWRFPCVAVCRRITSCGRQRSRCPPRCGFGWCLICQAEEGARLELAADQACPFTAGGDSVPGPSRFVTPRPQNPAAGASVDDEWDASCGTSVRDVADGDLP